MKKVIMIIAAVATMLAVAACGNNQSAQEQPAEATECCEENCEECKGECEECAKDCEKECAGDCENCEKPAEETVVE